MGSNSHRWFVCSLQLKTVARSCMHCDGCRVHSPNCQVCNCWKRACLKHGWLLGMWLSLGSRWLLQNQPLMTVMNCLGMSTGMLPYFASMSCPPFAYILPSLHAFHLFSSTLIWAFTLRDGESWGKCHQFSPTAFGLWCKQDNSFSLLWFLSSRCFVIILEIYSGIWDVNLLMWQLKRLKLATTPEYHSIWMSSRSWSFTVLSWASNFLLCQLKPAIAILWSCDAVIQHHGCSKWREIVKWQVLWKPQLYLTLSAIYICKTVYLCWAFLHMAYVGGHLHCAMGRDSFTQCFGWLDQFWGGTGATGRWKIGSRSLFMRRERSHWCIMDHAKRFMQLKAVSFRNSKEITPSSQPIRSMLTCFSCLSVWQWW